MLRQHRDFAVLWRGNRLNIYEELAHIFRSQVSVHLDIKCLEQADKLIKCEALAHLIARIRTLVLLRFNRGGLREELCHLIQCPRCLEA